MTVARTIAILLPNLGGGGAERVALTLAKAFVERGHSVDLVVMERTGELVGAVPPTVRIVDLQVKRMRNILPPLIRYLRKRRPDAIQISMWPLTIIGIIAVRASRVRMRVVVSDHATYSSSCLYSRQLKRLSWSVRLIYPLADHRVTVSESGAVDLAALTGIPRSRFEVIYNPIDVPRQIAATEEAERAWRGPGRRILTIGSLKSEKNHSLLLRAVARMEDTNAQLLILGEGPLRADLERLAAEVGIADRVAMPGFALDPWPYLASAELFVLSSDSEGFPLALAEAMHAGLRIVSTDCISGPAEMLDGGRFGKLVPVGDERALAKAMDEQLRLPHSPELVRERAESVSGPGVAERYLELLIGPQ